MSPHCVLPLILSIFTLQLIYSATYYKAINIDCPVNPKYLCNVSCKLKAINRYKSVANMQSVTIRPLRNISLHLSVLWKNSANKFKPFIIDFTANLCDAVDRKNFPVYAVVVLRVLKEFTNLNHSCPIEGPLIAKNLYLDERILSSILPHGIYKIILVFLEGYPYEEIGTANIYIETIETGIDKRVGKRKS